VVTGVARRWNPKEAHSTAKFGREETASSYPVVASRMGTSSLNLESSQVQVPCLFDFGFQKNSSLDLPGLLPLHHSPRHFSPALAPRIVNNKNPSQSRSRQLRTSVLVEFLHVSTAMEKSSRATGGEHTHEFCRLLVQLCALQCVQVDPD
jgi:hypothetical protein